MTHVHRTESASFCVHVLGTSTRYLLTAAETGGQSSIYRVGADPGMGVPTHTHEREDETFLIRQGLVRFEVSGRVIDAGAGDVVFGQRGTAHSWFVVGTEQAVFDVVTTPSGLETMFKELGGLAPGAPMTEVLAICARAGVSFG